MNFEEFQEQLPSLKGKHFCKIYGDYKKGNHPKHCEYAIDEKLVIKHCLEKQKVREWFIEATRYNFDRHGINHHLKKMNLPELTEGECKELGL